MALREMVIGQVAELYGKMRPAAGLQPEEAEALAAERKAFSSELIRLLGKVRFDQVKVEDAFRAVLHEVKSQPYTIKMPTPHELYRRVDSRLTVGVVRPYCPVCQSFGRSLVWADGPKHPEGRSRGQVAMGDGEWWCAQHFDVLTWYLHREAFHQFGKSFPYVPPKPMIGRDAFRPGRTGYDYQEWTDGAFSTDAVDFIRAKAVTIAGGELLLQPDDTQSEP